MDKVVKPLGRKAYGSIPHLPNSRMGPADHSCHEGQFTIACIKARDRHDRVIVTEKLDGSCMAVAKVNGTIHALGRAGYPASTSPYAHLREFEDYVSDEWDRFNQTLVDGERVVGEWMNVSTGTKYDLNHGPFVPFDIIIGSGREPHDPTFARLKAMDFPTPYVVSDGPPISVNDALNALGDTGKHGALEEVEGCVWRVERRGQFDFLAKFVRHDKIDGKYLPGLHGNTEYIRNHARW